MGTHALSSSHLKLVARSEILKCLEHIARTYAGEQFSSLKKWVFKNTRYSILVIIYALKLERNYYAQ